MIAVHLNELSAVGQFNGRPWQKGLSDLFDCLNLFRGKEKKCARFYSRSLYARPFLYNKTVLASVLARHPDYNIKLKSYLKEFSLLENEADKASMSASYDLLIINFQFSPITEDATSSPPSFSSAETLAKYLKSKGLIGPSYDFSSSIPPRDEETILSDTNLFQITRHSYHGRKMYKRNGTSELWYVDNFHYGQDAHIEVFNETTQKQIHVSRIDRIDYFRPLTDSEKSRVLLFDDGR